MSNGNIDREFRAKSTSSYRTMETYYNGQPVQYSLPPTPIQGCPHLPGLQVPNYFQGHNIQTGNMYIPTNNNMNQQIAQVPA
jgi:hypothetical protein